VVGRGAGWDRTWTLAPVWDLKSTVFVVVSDTLEDLGVGGACWWKT
jgi:hypothetical protein